MELLSETSAIVSGIIWRVYLLYCGWCMVLNTGGLFGCCCTQRDDNQGDNIGPPRGRHILPATPMGPLLSLVIS